MGLRLSQGRGVQSTASLRPRCPPRPSSGGEYSLWAANIIFIRTHAEDDDYTFQWLPWKRCPDGDVMAEVIGLHGNPFDLPNGVPSPYTEL